MARGIGVLAAIVALWSCGPASAQPSSPSFVLQRSTLSSAGQTAFAPDFRLKFVMGRDVAVGVSANPSFILQSGFWSFVASGPIPVVLAVDRNESDDASCDLSWSGNDPPYEIYVAEDCTDVFGSLYTTTSDNALADVTPAAGQLTCFNVVPMTVP